MRIEYYVEFGQVGQVIQARRLSNIEKFGRERQFCIQCVHLFQAGEEI